ncbi:Transposase (plasmid) [Shigella dysenteriae WRSd5]|nr:Transposase [Shigella dysenteriae WRSd5]
MSRKTQRYSTEFKAEAVKTVPENQLSISEGPSRLSVPEGTLGFRTMGYRRQKRARYSWFPHGG